MAIETPTREAAAGETVDWWGDQRVVAKTCDVETGAWYCVTHAESFRANWMVTSHSDDGKRHLLTWVCAEHGPENSGTPE